jgi:SAM-dependent methyltransferase
MSVAEPLVERIAGRFSARNRELKWHLFRKAFPVRADLRILDVGFTDIEYSPVDNYLEKHHPYPESITALGTDHPSRFPRRYPCVRTVRYDGLRFPFADRAFSIVWSNAVLEHVGRRERQVQFLREVKRVGHGAFLTTPNRMFPIEVHTRTPLLHWLPRLWFDRYLRSAGKAWAAGDYLHMVSERELRRLLDEAGVTQYRILHNRVFGFVLDFVVVWGSAAARAGGPSAEAELHR